MGFGSARLTESLSPPVFRGDGIPAFVQSALQVLINGRWDKIVLGSAAQIP